MDNWSHGQQAAAGSSANRPSKAARTNNDQDAAAAAAGQQGSKPQIKLPVPSGQLHLGRLLIKSMYEAQPALSAVSQDQLVQLIVLADRYEVPKAAAAAAAVLGALLRKKLQWGTVFTVYSLPGGCAGMEACKQLQEVAASKVRKELGDLEVVWGDRDKQQLLMQLPFGVLQQQLSDKRTRAASEDTVLYTLERWYAEQQKQQHISDEDLRQLVGRVRMRCCSSAYVASVFAAGVVAERALRSDRSWQLR
jgi:hypothetical protein